MSAKNHYILHMVVAVLTLTLWMAFIVSKDPIVRTLVSAGIGWVCSHTFFDSLLSYERIKIQEKFDRLRQEIIENEKLKSKTKKGGKNE